MQTTQRPLRIDKGSRGRSVKGVLVQVGSATVSWNIGIKYRTKRGMYCCENGNSTKPETSIIVRQLKK